MNARWPGWWISWFFLAVARSIIDRESKSGDPFSGGAGAYSGTALEKQEIDRFPFLCNNKTTNYSFLWIPKEKRVRSSCPISARYARRRVAIFSERERKDIFFRKQDRCGLVERERERDLFFFSFWEQKRLGFFFFERDGPIPWCTWGLGRR